MKELKKIIQSFKTIQKLLWTTPKKNKKIKEFYKL